MLHFHLLLQTLAFPHVGSVFILCPASGRPCTKNTDLGTCEGKTKATKQTFSASLYGLTTTYSVYNIYITYKRP